MFQTRRPPKKYHRYAWLLGFTGLSGFGYFASHDISDLFFFSFFGFFSFYFTAKLAAEMPDERYEENRLRAKAATMFVPAVVLLCIGLGMVYGILSSAGIILLAALGWAATFLIYAVAFWYYEKH